MDDVTVGDFRKFVMEVEPGYMAGLDGNPARVAADEVSDLAAAWLRGGPYLGPYRGGLTRSEMAEILRRAADDLMPRK